MKRTKQEYLNLLNETVNYYSEDTNRRAVSDGMCEYTTKDGKHCAVGRCLNKEGLKLGEEAGDVGHLEWMTDEDDIDSIMKEPYRGYDLEFWTQLQGLHDVADYWDENGLTEEGEKKVKRIKEEFNLYI